MDMDFEGIKKLLSEVGKIRAKIESYNQISGRGFNIFSIANIATDEVAICRVLHALLDPKGSHYQGAAFLKLFVEYVLNQEGNAPLKFTEEEYENAIVSREHSLDTQRRIDVYIRIGRFRIPIEAKIYACDQNRQCEDYAKYASAETEVKKDMPVYYLTLDGRMPSEESIGNLAHDRIRCISFKKDILRWLEECLRLPEVIRTAPIREILLQLQDTVRELTGTLEDSMQDDLVKLISTPEGMYNAVKLGKALEEAKEQMLYKVFKTLDKEITGTYTLPRYNQENDYLAKKDSNPVISYAIAKEEDKSYCLRIYIFKGRLAVGLLILKDNKVLSENKMECHFSELQAEVLDTDWKSYKYWIAWKTVDLSGKQPDFANYNKDYCALWNKSDFEAFISDVMASVSDLIEKINAKEKFTIAINNTSKDA